MNTSVSASTKAFGIAVLAVFSLLFVQADTVYAVSGGRDRSDPCYLDPSSCAAGGGGGKDDSGTPLKPPPESKLILLQPLDDATYSLEPKPGIQIFFDYFNLSWPWILGVSAGLAVLQAMIGGMLMMSVEYKDMGKERMQWAVGGLLVIALAGLILTTINPIFFN